MFLRWRNKRLRQTINQDRGTEKVLMVADQLKEASSEASAASVVGWADAIALGILNIWEAMPFLHPQAQYLSYTYYLCLLTTASY